MQRYFDFYDYVLEPRSRLWYADKEPALARDVLRNWPRCDFPQGDKVGALAPTSTFRDFIFFDKCRS